MKGERMKIITDIAAVTRLVTILQSVPNGQAEMNADLESLLAQCPVIPDLTYELYAQIPALNKSLLSKMASTPADALLYLQSGGEMSDDLLFGIGAHCLLWEPARFAAHFTIGPDVKLNTKEGKAEWANFCAGNPGRTHIRGKDGQAMLGMRAALQEHPLASAIVRASGMAESTMVWRDEFTGAWCKARPDWDFVINDEISGLLADSGVNLDAGVPVMADYKTARDASKWGFSKAYGTYKYYLQEAMYRDGRAVAMGEDPAAFFFIAQEKTAPYKCNVFTFDRQRVDQGRRLYREMIDLHKQCMLRRQWPALDGREYVGGLLADVRVPEFAMHAADDATFE